MSSVDSPTGCGYGWGMDDSARLRDAVASRADRRAGLRRVPVQDVITTMAAREASRRGIPVAQFLEKITDPERGDQLLAEAERRLHLERIHRQAEILLARLPSKYRHADFPKTTFGHRALEWLTDYRKHRAAGKPHRSLVILGATGTGKTWTGCAIIRALLTEDTVPCTMVTVADMLEQLRPASGGLDIDMLQFSGTPVLMLDDLGMERLTEWGREQLYRLADERARNDLPVIVTSNLTGEQIKAQYDERTVQRLFGGAQLIEIDGDSRRTLPF